MSIKSGQFLHVAGMGTGFVIDRIQSGGAGNLNIPEEKIYELGNYQTVATVRDTPDLSFDLESFDTSTEWEALLTGVDPTTTVDGQSFDFKDAMPLDIISPFKDKSGVYTVIRGVAIPYLALESVSYRFGVGQNATQSATLRGDGIYYFPGSPYVEEFTVTAGTNQVYTLAHTAFPYVESGDTLYGVSVCAKNPSTNEYRRLFYGEDYTNTSTAITVLDDLSTEGYTKLHVTYGSAAAATYPQAVHPSDAVKPAAVRAKDIDVYVSDGAATPTLVRWKGVQNFEVNWRVTLDKDEEFGNARAVAQDYDVPEVSGSITVKPVDAEYLFELIQQVANISSTEVAGALTSTPLALELRIRHPQTGARIKTLYVEDARIQVPALQGRVQQKLSVTFPFTSDGGNLEVFQGAR
jgi:hypothetical protein